MITKRRVTHDELAEAATEMIKLEKEPETVPTLQESAARLRAAFAVSVDRMAREDDALEVTKEVVKDLNASKREVTMKLLGLENKWGGQWEVDHCNNRKSPIADRINDECKALIDTWVNEAIKEVLTDELKGKFKDKYKATLRADINTRVNDRYRCYETANSIADQLLNEASKELRKELGIN